MITVPLDSRVTREGWRRRERRTKAGADYIRDKLGPCGFLCLCRKKEAFFEDVYAVGGSALGFLLSKGFTYRLEVSLSEDVTPQGFQLILGSGQAEIDVDLTPKEKWVGMGPLDKPGTPFCHGCVPKSMFLTPLREKPHV